MAQRFAFPLTVTGGRLACHTQDSPAEIAQSVALLLSTQPGERIAVPDYGWPSPLGVGIDFDQIADVIGEWEPRADPATVELTLDTVVEQHATVHPATPQATTTEEA